MKREENSVGTIKCDCGSLADVRQSKKAGRYLYTVCPECKVDQRTGAPVQNRIYHLANFDKQVIKPANVRDDWQQKTAEPEAKPVAEPEQTLLSETEQSSDDLTAEELAGSLDEKQPEAQQTLEPKRKRGGFVQALGVIILAACGLGAIWKSV